MNEWIIFTEILNENGPGYERFYYDIYDNETQANEIAFRMERSFPVFHCVCAAEDAIKMKIQRIPTNVIDRIQKYNLSVV